MKSIVVISLIFSVTFPTVCFGKNFDPEKAKEKLCKLEQFGCKPTGNVDTGEHPGCQCYKDSRRLDIYGNDLNKMIEFRQHILDFHNERRNFFASGQETRQVVYAADMMAMNYDLQLEYYARCRVLGSMFNPKFATSKTVVHEPCQMMPNGGVHGQNAAGSTSEDLKDPLAHKDDFDALVNSWYEEVQYWPPSDPQSFAKFGSARTRGGTGHFTQLVWAKANLVGCAAAWIPPEANTNEIYKFTILCNYYSNFTKFGGNLMGAPILKPVASIGETCTKCYKGTSCDKSSKYPYLCGTINPVPKNSPYDISENSEGGGSSSENKLRIGAVLFIILLISVF